MQSKPERVAPHAESGWSQGRFRALAALIVFLAFLLRAWFVLAADIEHPIRGDIVQYVAYAWNLLEHATFSSAPASAVAPGADAFRGPGYPLFLAASMLIGGLEGGWYSVALALQVLMGTATVLLTVLIGRDWLTPGWTLAAGLLAALWPHHIAATGALLTEVVHGFFVILGLWLALRSTRRKSLAWAVCGALVLGFAYLVNQVALLLPLFVFALLWSLRRRRQALVFLVLPLAVAGGWGARSLAIDGHQDQSRLLINFVQGSWPLYHAAYASRFAHEVPRQILQEMREETDLLHADPQAGLQRIGGRLAQQPWDYAWWYALSKPYLLWDWDIRIGAGDVYFHQVESSILERQPLLAVKLLLEAMNPVLFWLAAVASLWLLLGWRWTLAGPGPAPLLVAALCVYVTAVHVALQAEPRYAIPYRPEQILLACTSLFFLARRARTRLAFVRADNPLP